jgi:hypothetical protein
VNSETVPPWVPLMRRAAISRLAPCTYTQKPLIYLPRPKPVLAQFHLTIFNSQNPSFRQEGFRDTYSSEKKHHAHLSL